MSKQIKPILLLTLMMILMLNACSPFAIVSSSGAQPESVDEVVEVAAFPVVDEQPTPFVGEAGGFRPVEVVDVTVEFGTESAIVAYAVINFNLPDSCAQVEHVRTVQDGDTFFITVSTIHSKAEGCIQDTLPQRVTVPFNIADLPVGEYAVNVNGIHAEFSVAESESTGDLRTAHMPNYLDDVAVDSLSVVNGVGSPLPIHAVIEASLPKSCGQLGEVQMSREGNTFFVRLTAELPAQTDCNNDDLPLRIALPLNIVGLPYGTYEVNVNGVTTTFELPVK